MRFPAILSAVLSVIVGAAWAESTPKPPVTVEQGYRSAFAGYRGLKDEAVTAWRERNDEMRRLGGHMGHLGNPADRSDAAPADREARTDRKPTEQK